jgi:glycolate oxidase
LRSIVSGEGVIEQETGRRPYESDALTAYRALPIVVVLRDNVAQVRGVLSYCHEKNVKVVPRGAGTSLSGGALLLADGVLLSMMKFNLNSRLDLLNRLFRHLWCNIGATRRGRVYVAQCP